MTSSESPPPVWIRTSLDAFLAVEYALRSRSNGHIHIYNNVPPSEERDALIRAGNVIIWDEPKKSHKQRWKYSSSTTWSNSRMIGNFLVYRQTSKGRKNSPAQAPQLGHDHLYEVFCAHRNHKEFPAGGLMRKTMTLNIGENKTHFINFYNPYMQLDPQEALPQPSSLPLFAHLTYDLRPDILFTKHRQPPIVNIMTAGNVERFVYGGEYGADLPERHAHIQGAIKYWTQRLKVVPEVRPLKVDPHSKPSKPSVCEDPMPSNTSESETPASIEEDKVEDVDSPLVPPSLIVDIASPGPAHDWTPNPEYAPSWSFQPSFSSPAVPTFTPPPPPPPLEPLYPQDHPPKYQEFDADSTQFSFYSFSASSSYPVPNIAPLEPFGPDVYDPIGLGRRAGIYASPAPSTAYVYEAAPLCQDQFTQSPSGSNWMSSYSYV